MKSKVGFEQNLFHRNIQRQAKNFGHGMGQKSITGFFAANKVQTIIWCSDNFSIFKFIGIELIVQSFNY
jgi:hypothetical protein